MICDGQSDVQQHEKCGEIGSTVLFASLLPFPLNWKENEKDARMRVA